MKLERIARMVLEAVSSPEDGEDVELSEPFEGAVEVATRTDSIFPALVAVATPTGDELVHKSDCDEDTQVYPKGYFDSVRNDICAHRHGTVPSMPAVKAS